MNNETISEKIKFDLIKLFTFIESYLRDKTFDLMEKIESCLKEVRGVIRPMRDKNIGQGH